MKKENMLKNTVLFAALNDLEIRALAEIVIEKTYPKDKIIFKEGDTTTSLYVIVKGRANAISVSQDGKQIVHNTFKSGDYFGEMSFIDGEPRSAAIETKELTQLFVIPRDQFRRIFSSNPDISFNLMKELTRKIRETTRQVEDILFIVMQRELHDSHLDTINRLALAAEYKDENTGKHVARVSRYSALIAKEYGLSDEMAANIRHAAPMHDVGKIGIPEYILLKPGKLTVEEFNTIKTHTTIGAKLLANSKSAVLRCAYQIALFHHEKFNGKGYPGSVKGNKTPIAGRIVGLVDTFDALISSRPYKSPYPVTVALDIIKKDRGKYFDPDLVDVFNKNIATILKIREELRSEEDVTSDKFTWSERDQKERNMRVG